MEKSVISSVVLILGVVAFSCCVAAEFTKSKASRDMKLDGSLCSLKRSSAFVLGITALISLSVAQIAGTSASLCSCKSMKSRKTSIALLILSWLSFGLAAIMLGTASSISNHQAYGRGWLEGDCYLVKDGVYVGSAILAISAVIFILGFALTAAGRRAKKPGKWRRFEARPKDSIVVASSAGKENEGFESSAVLAVDI